MRLGGVVPFCFQNGYSGRGARHLSPAWSSAPLWRWRLSRRNGCSFVSADLVFTAACSARSSPAAVPISQQHRGQDHLHSHERPAFALGRTGCRQRIWRPYVCGRVYSPRDVRHVRFPATAVGYNWGEGKYSRVRAIERCCYIGAGGRLRAVGADSHALSGTNFFSLPRRIGGESRVGDGSGNGDAALRAHLHHPLVLVRDAELYASRWRNPCPPHSFPFPRRSCSP